MADDFRCLAIETATLKCTVALAANAQRNQRELASSRESSREIYAAIADLLSSAGIELSSLDCIAFGCGPGSFTGLRVAAGVAQGLAYAQDLPVCRISTLAALAQVTARDHEQGNVAACLDARMGEVYLGLYATQAAEAPGKLANDRLMSPAEVQLDERDEWLAVGSGWEVWPELRERLDDCISASIPDLWPDADAVLTLAEYEFRQGNVVSASGAIPNYLRNKVTG